MVQSMMWCSQTVSQFGLLIFCLIISNPYQVSALTINNFFSFGPANGDTQLPDGDDLVDSQTFSAPFLFYGQAYTSFGVSKIM